MKIFGGSYLAGILKSEKFKNETIDNLIKLVSVNKTRKLDNKISKEEKLEYYLRNI